MEILWINLLDNQLGNFQCFPPVLILYKYIWLSVSFETLNNFYQWTLFTGETIIFHINASIHIKFELIDTKAQHFNGNAIPRNALPCFFFCLKKRKSILLNGIFQVKCSSVLFECEVNEWTKSILFKMFIIKKSWYKMVWMWMAIS